MGMSQHEKDLAVKLGAAQAQGRLQQLEIERLQAENAELKKTLAPFAALGEHRYAKGRYQERELTQLHQLRFTPQGRRLHEVTAADFLAAYAVIGDQPQAGTPVDDGQDELNLATQTEQMVAVG